MMLIAIYILIFIFSGIVSAYITGLVRRYSLNNQLIDIPNERSSHHNPTPRGGGLSIVIITTSILPLLYYLDLIDTRIIFALASGGIIVAIMGWLDDHWNLSPLIRAFAYSIAAILSLYFLGGIQSVRLGEYILSNESLNNILAFLGLFWMINLFNFMDGTDAFAALQTIFTGLIASVLFLYTGQFGLAVFSIVIVSSSAGFLFWNWPPARIFMGDVGSCYIGFCFGMLALIGEKTNTINISIFIILMGIFICDATFTLIMRIARMEKWYSAHKSHAYQRLVQLGISHKQLAAGSVLINISLLLPLAIIAFKWQGISLFILLLMTLLMFIAWSIIQYQYKSFLTDRRIKTRESN